MRDKRQIFLEFDKHLLEDEKPSGFFNDEAQAELFDEVYPFTMLGVLKKIEQSPQHHPEGNVWNHTMQVTDKAAERKHLSSNSRVFMWSALLHDLGKAPTTKVRKGRITAYDHDAAGEKLAVRFLKDLTVDTQLIDDVASMVRWHMQILFVVKDLPFANIKDMMSQVSVEEIALLSLCDRLGREPMSREKAEQESRNVDVFKEKCELFLKQQSKH